MTIPNITKQNIIDALKYIDENGIPFHNQSTKYELVLDDGKKYPPKYVIAIADHLANGSIISTESFNAGEAKSYLEKQKFIIKSKLQENYILTITANGVESTDEEFTMDNLSLGDNFEPIDVYFMDSNGKIVKRNRSPREKNITNQTMPRIAFQIYEKQISEMSDEDKKSFPICKYSPAGALLHGIYSSIDEYKNYKNSREYMTYNCANGKSFIIYSWNIFSTILFVKECLKRFGKAGDKFILTYTEKGKNEKVSDSIESVISEVNEEFLFNNLQKSHKNLILYGPPGTGKTYNTIIQAMEILGSQSVNMKDNKGKFKTDYSPDEYKELKKEFDNYKNEGRIEFITFHQSYSYEEFVEGIKPLVPDGENWGCELEKLKYYGRDGIFKNICKQAQKITTSNANQKIDFTKTRIFKMSLGNTLENDNDIYEYCISNNLIALGYGEDSNFSECKTYEDIKAKGIEGFAADAVNRFLFWMRKGDIVLISNGNRNIRAIAQITGDYDYKENSEIRYHQFRGVKWLYIGDDIPVSKFYNKQLSQATIYGFYAVNKENTPQYNGSIKTDIINDIITGDINKHPQEPYVLIIDEINRGNISKIFGELITLIEEDKRGKLHVKLPYSQEDFTVPENLYIIGTMNTSDRSIASVDIALRRRFKFKEMMPKPELVADFGCGFKEIFKVLNKKISILLDRDHQIGHSYFIKDKYEHADRQDLKYIWFDSVMPLLNEYFYGDWEKLQEILGVAKEEKDMVNGKYTSFIKNIDDSCIKEKSCYDNTTDCFDFVTEDEVDFKAALDNAFPNLD